MSDKLHVIDRGLRSHELRNVMDPGVIKRATQHLARAKRFILTDNASTRMGEIIKSVEGLMLSNTQFAIPPYDDCYFEINNDLLYAAAGKITTFPRGNESDNRVGMLTHKNRDGSYDVTGFALTHKGECSASPFVYHRYAHKPTCSLRRFIELVLTQDDSAAAKRLATHDNLEEWGRLAIMLGTGLGEIPSEEARQQIAHEWSLQPAFDKRFWPYEKGISYTCSSGDVRNLLCLLLLINQPMLYSFTSVKHSHGIWKGKRVVYSGHSLIEISLGQRKMARRIFEHLGPRKSPVRHEVRGHFAHWHLGNDCSHDWPVLPTIEEDGIPRWTCKRCSGLRVWREHFVRGDSAQGWADHEYSLT